MHLFEALQQHLPNPCEDRDRQLFGQWPGPRAVAFGDRIAGACLRRELEPGYEMAEVEEILQDHQRVRPALVKPPHLLERRRRIAAQHALHQIEDEAAIGDPQHVAHGSFRDPPPRESDRLVEQGEPVAHRAVGGPGDQREGRRLDLDALRLGNPTIMRYQLFDRDAA